MTGKTKKERDNFYSTRQTNMLVMGDLHVLTSFCYSVFYCRCGRCLLFLTQSILMIMGTIEVTSLKNAFDNLL